MARVPGRPPAILTVQAFVDIYTVLLRYFELLSAMKHDDASDGNDNNNGPRHTCLICLNEDSDVVVLSCTHSLCSTCHKRWVTRKLTCPFCRHTFHQRSASLNQWEMLEWKEKDAAKDVIRLEAILEKEWNGLDFSSNCINLLIPYQPITRTIAVREQGGILMIEGAP